MRIGRERIGDDSHLIQFSSGRELPGSHRVFVVPEDRYFVLGDHRNNSADSRYWGYVEEDRIIGGVSHVAVSLSRQRPLGSRVAIHVD